MKGIEATKESFDRERLRLSRLIELERIPESEGRRLLNKVIDLRDEVEDLERELVA